MPEEAHLFKYKIVIVYDGTHYGGWQVQKNAVSIQSLIESSLSRILRARTTLSGSGRTDARVHSLGQTAHFTTDSTIAPSRILFSLNGLLPPDIRILSIERMPMEFHARYSAISKVYHYHLHLDPIPDPFKHLYSYHVPHPVDLDLLKETAQYFVGTHDFSSFANEGHKGSAAKNAVRTIYRLDIVDEPGGVRLEFEGNGFLYKMVRNIVGTLLDVCAGKIAKEHIPEIFAAKDRRQAGRAAPPHGLYLMEVKYEDSDSK